MSWIDEAAQATGVNLRRHGTARAVGPCPYCKERFGDGGDDRFIVFPEGNYFCNVCNEKGWWIKEAPTKAVVQQRLREKAEQTQLAYANMHTNEDWLYFGNEPRLDLWAERGITKETVHYWGLGFCNAAPYTEPPTPSLTIPVFYGQKLYDIRHRVLGAQDGQKYRSHLRGIVPIFFNLDNLGAAQQVYLVEGELKAIYLMQEGIGPVVAYPGIQFITYLPGLVKRHGTPGQEFIAIPDPGTTPKVVKHLGLLGEHGYKCSVVELIDKPDDFTRDFGTVCTKDAIRMRRYI